ncbi:MAG: cytidine deaminase [bacterium]|jgi:cytidine deaminase
MNIEQILDKYFEVIKNELIFYNNNSYSPYSGFRVSSVLVIDRNGKLEFVGGTNVENSSYGLTVCAERVSIFKAVSQGMINDSNNKWLGLFLYVPVEDFVLPCGACRQVISEFVEDIPIVVFNKNFDYKVYKLSDIFKEVFGSRFLNK